MSYFDDASLVMIPSGYKDQKVYSVKPIDGSGDLTFSRASNATRVNSSGLVERVRTNEILYSQDFSNAAWTKGGVGTYTSAITTGFTDPNGGTNAQRWLATIASVSDRAFVRQLATLTNGIPYTISFWVKSNTASSQDIYFMFQGGAVQATTATTSWQRISYSATTSTTAVLVGIEAKDLAIDVLVYGFQLEVGDVMTDYIATTSAAVSVGPVSGLPRLDYSGGALCPSLLLEPQRTNLFTFSESFDNAAWIKSAVATTITANSTISPSGYQDADTWTINAAGARYVGQTKTVTAGAVTASFFVKKGTSDWFYIRIEDGANYAGFTFNVSTGQLGQSVSSVLTPTASIVDYGNGWYRCIVTTTVAGTSVLASGWVATSASTISGTLGASLICWGAQLEEGAYATSYIPTLSSAVTRVADAASKTGISSLIGQTEGTVYIEMSPIGGTTSYTERILKITGGTDEIGIYRYGNDILYVSGLSGGVVSFELQKNSVIYTGQTYKIAIGYKLNDVAAYLNGVQIGTDTSAAMFTSLANMQFANDTSAGFLAPQNVKQTLLFKTRLSNADLATLTTL